MAGRVYIVDLAQTAVTAAVDLVELTPADDKPIEVLGFELYQVTDVGDAAEEIIGVEWIRGHTVSGSGGATPTPRPLDPNEAAAGFTAETLNTTPANTGTTVILQNHGWNVRIPTPIVYTPETVPKASQANTTLILRMLNAPADSLTIGGHITVREL